MKNKLFLILIMACLLLWAVPEKADAAEITNTYTINGVEVAWSDYSSRPGNCRAYAEKIYEKIWGTGFSSYFYDDNNLLRELDNEELTLTEEHLKEYVSQAELGSTIRVSSLRFLHRNDGNLGHSQIIVQKDENGFTVLEGGLSAYPYCAENYYTWSDFVNAHWLGGKYGYIKYIKWPGAPVYNPNLGEETPVVSRATMTRADTESSFTLTYTAEDDLAVEDVYVQVWPQGWAEAAGESWQCDWDGSTATVTVNCDTSGDVKNFYYRWYAVDGNGNVGGGDQAPKLISFYEPDTHCRGICTVTASSAPVSSAPYSHLNGADTVKYWVNEGSNLTITGFYTNSQGQKWYSLEDGSWISGEYVRYHTLASMIEWFYRNYLNKEVVYLDGQILFMGD